MARIDVSSTPAKDRHRAKRRRELGIGSAEALVLVRVDVARRQRVLRNEHDLARRVRDGLADEPEEVLGLSDRLRGRGPRRASREMQTAPAAAKPEPCAQSSFDSAASQEQ